MADGGWVEKLTPSEHPKRRVNRTAPINYSTMSSPCQTVPVADEPIQSVRTADGKYMCSKCGAIKERPNTMFYHIQKHKGNHKYVCDEPGCTRTFVQRNGLTQHKIQAHSPDDIQLFTCPFCPHTSKTKPNIIIHVGRCHSKGWVLPMNEDGTCAGCASSPVKDKVKVFNSETAYCYHAVSCFRHAPTAPQKELDVLLEVKARKPKETKEKKEKTENVA